MREKTVIGFVGDTICPMLLSDIQARLVEAFGEECIEFVELGGDYSYGRCVLDIFAPAPHELEAMIRRSVHIPFRIKYADRIQRHHRVWPRIGRPMFQWNRRDKWLPRFYAASRRSYSSQSRSGLSQESSSLVTVDSRPHTVCSLEGLDLSRWP